VKNGSAASELAADAHHCIMVWVFGPPHTRMWHDPSCTNPQLPSDVVIPTRSSVPSCSKPSRTSLRWRSRAIFDRFCARRRQELRSGRGKACGAVELEKSLEEVRTNKLTRKKWRGPEDHPP
jgi:hypothetical protein